MGVKDNSAEAQEELRRGIEVSTIILENYILPWTECW